MSTIYVDTFATIAITALVPPFFGLVVLVVILASLGKSLGIRQRYVKLLLKIFEFGKQRLDQKRKLSTAEEITDEESEEFDEVDSNRSQIQDIIFKPPADKNAKILGGTHEFQLSDSFEYIVNGMEAIVDDEVTKRFAAEELTSWNFLTRTNCDYEFISVRLTVFWVSGFIVRYVFLLPMRVCIMAIGVGFLVTCSSVISLIPECQFREWIGVNAYLTCFRIIARSISSVMHFHNPENRPKCDGICVANHTSPIDCIILSTDNVYGFVSL